MTSWWQVSGTRRRQEKCSLLNKHESCAVFFFIAVISSHAKNVCRSSRAIFNFHLVVAVTQVQIEGEELSSQEYRHVPLGPRPQIDNRSYVGGRCDINNEQQVL